MTDSIKEIIKKIMKILLKVIVDKKRVLQYYNYAITFQGELP